VTLLINGYYRQLVEQHGFDYAELMSADEYQEFLTDCNFWQHSHSVWNWSLWKDLRRWVADVYQFIADRYQPGDTVVAALAYFFGARVAQEKLGVPLASVHMQPLWIRSVYDVTGFNEHWPLWTRRALDRIVDGFLDKVLGPSTNAFRAELGLPPARRIAKQWWHSPELVIGFFPDWFAAPQPDWPPNTLLPGWPYYFGANDFDATELNEFLAEGSPPLVFSLSSVTADARHYFEVAIEVAQHMNRRAILLTPYAEQVPARLPNTVRHFSFVPLEVLLPRAALHVHHGGSGTVAHTLAAGIPQVTVPQGLDQVDIGKRLMRLGVSRNLSPKKFFVDRVTRAAGDLLQSPAVAQRCRHYAELCHPSEAVKRASDALERLAAGHKALDAARLQA
jgi:rhamnosyltransferase subunit B